MLKLQNIECGYGRIKVLEGINFEVGAESVGLFGPNGAGKTTLISAIMGMVKPWKGSIEFEGKQIGGLETYHIARMGVALVPQERELFPGLSVEDNLILGSVYIPHAKTIVQHSVEKVYQLFPILKERRAQIAGTLSGGQQRMLAIGRALMSKPKLLILDEPSLGLQPSTRCRGVRGSKRLKASVSILVTEQNVRESLRAIDRGYVLENGRIVLEDSAEGLKTNPHVIKSYLGI